MMADRDNELLETNPEQKAQVILAIEIDSNSLSSYVHPISEAVILS